MRKGITQQNNPFKLKRDELTRVREKEMKRIERLMLKEMRRIR